MKKVLFLGILAVSVAVSAGIGAEEAEPPEIFGGSQSVDLFEGQTVELRAGVAGTPPLFYQWHFNGLPVPGETNESYLLVNIVTNQSGGYSLTVSNIAGLAESG